MSKRLRIVYVSRELGLTANSGGIGTYVWDVSRALAASGHSVTVLSSSYTPDQSSDSVVDGVRVIKLPDAHTGGAGVVRSVLSFRRAFYDYRTRVADRLDQLIASDGVDVVEFAEFGAESAVWQERQRRVPMILRWHTPIGRDWSLQRLVWAPVRSFVERHVKAAVAAADAVTYPSQWMQERVDEVHASFPNGFVIPNGINVREWLREGVPATARGTPERIVFAGTLVPRKGYAELIRATRLLRRTGRNVQVVLAGRETWHSKKELRRHRDAVDEGWLLPIGAVSRDVLRGLFQGADVCCFPSWHETIGLVCLEAMASGSIVVGSLNSGMREAIEHGRSGYLTKPRCPRELARVLRHVLELSDDEKRVVRENAMRRVVREFDNEAVVPKLLDLYAQTRMRYL